MLMLRWLWLTPLAVALACGGRFQQAPDGSGDDDDDVTGTAGTLTSGGVTGSGGKSSKAGTGGKPTKGGSAGKPGASFGGTVAVAGSPSSGGSAAVGGACFCDAVACGIDFRPVPNPDGCCFHCELDLKACEGDRQSYRQLRAQMVEKFSTIGCMTNEECTVYYDKTNCGSSCGIALPISAVKDFESNLNSTAQGTCSPACPPEPVPPCAPRPAPQCLKGRCY